MIEYSIFCLARQAEGIADGIPLDPDARADLAEAARYLDLAAGRHHDAPAFSEDRDWERKGQLELLTRVEARLAEGGVDVLINKEPARRAAD